MTNKTDSRDAPSSERIVYVAMTNTDLTEGRGWQIPLAVCEAESTAIRFAKKAYVMGADAPVEAVGLLLHEGKWYAPISIIRIHRPTQEDTSAQKALNAHREALEKAKAAGLTEEDIKALGGRQ